MVSKYLTNVAMMSESTAMKYNERLGKFETFVSEHYGIGIDEIIKRIMRSKIDVYIVLVNYIRYLKERNTNHSISPNTLKNYVITIKNFLEYSDIDISPRKFKLGYPKLLRLLVTAPLVRHLSQIGHR